MEAEKEFTPELVWQIIAELGEQQKKLGEKQKESAIAAEQRAAEWERRNAEYERERKESAAESAAAAERRAAEWERRNAEYERERKKSNAEWEKRMKELQNNIGGVSASNGAMAEEMIFNSLEQDKTFAGVKFEEVDRNIKLHSRFLDVKGEFDVILKNGDTVAIVESKYKVRSDDIAKLVDKQVKDFRKLFPMYSNYKIILGIGGMSFEQKAIEDAQNKGVGIIKIVGDKVEFHTEGIKTY